MFVIQRRASEEAHQFTSPMTNTFKDFMIKHRMTCVIVDGDTTRAVGVRDELAVGNPVALLGDWIVYKETGEYDILNNQEFHQKYAELTH